MQTNLKCMQTNLKCMQISSNKSLRNDKWRNDKWKSFKRWALKTFVFDVWMMEQFSKFASTGLEKIIFFQVLQCSGFKKFAFGLQKIGDKN